MPAPVAAPAAVRRRIVVQIDGELVRLLRHMAVDRSTTMAALIERAVRDLLEGRGALDSGRGA